MVVLGYTCPVQIPPRFTQELGPSREGRRGKVAWPCGTTMSPSWGTNNDGFPGPWLARVHLALPLRIPSAFCANQRYGRQRQPRGGWLREGLHTI